MNIDRENFDAGVIDRVRIPAWSTAAYKWAQAESKFKPKLKETIILQRNKKGKSEWVLEDNALHLKKLADEIAKKERAAARVAAAQAKKNGGKRVVARKEETNGAQTKKKKRGWFG